MASFAKTKTFSNDEKIILIPIHSLDGSRVAGSVDDPAAKPFFHA